MIGAIARRLFGSANDRFLKSLQPPNRVGQNDFSGGKTRSQLGDDARIDTTFEGTAERNADRHCHRQLGALDDV